MQIGPSFTAPKVETGTQTQDRHRAVLSTLVGYHRMANVTLKSGLNSLSVDVPEGTTVGAILGNPNYAAALGYDSSNVEGVLNGVVAGSGATVYGGDVLLAQKKAHSKA